MGPPAKRFSLTDRGLLASMIPTAAIAIVQAHIDLVVTLLCRAPSLASDIGYE